MLNKNILLFFKFNWLFKLSNVTFFLIGCMILIAQSYWFLGTSQIKKFSNFENNEIFTYFDDQFKSRVFAYFRLSEDKKSIRIVSKLDVELSRLDLESKILAFRINDDGTLMAVSVYDLKDPLLIYDLKSLKIIKKIPFKRFSRLLEFSIDNRFLIVGDGYNSEITSIDLLNNRKEFLTLPTVPLSFMSGKEGGELFVRSENEVLKLRIYPFELLERNSMIEFSFGGEIFTLDPSSFCNTFGIPHPLLLNNKKASDFKGMKGFYYKNN